MAGGIDWFRWHHGTVNDPKFGLVAKRAQARLCEVLAVWACLLEAASAAEDRGNAGQPDFESMDHHLGLEEGTAQRIYTCICERGLVDSTSGRLSAWEKRQPKRERVDDSSTERTREYRERQRLTKTGDAHEHGVTPRDANDGQGTAGDATCHTGTPRGEERREELSPPAAQVTPSRTRVKATKTSIADDFAISDRVRAWAAQKGFDRLEEHLQAFGRKCKASGYAYARVREEPREPSDEAAQNEVADEVVDPDPPGGRRGPGRPTKYRPEFAAAILAYFEKEPYTEVDVPQPSGLVKRQRMATDPPMLAGFARSIGASLRTINRWAVELNSEGKPRYPEFADAYAVARELQEALIARGGLLGLYDTRIAPFILKNLHAWQDHPAKTTDVAPISKEELEATYIRDIEEAHATQDALDAQRREWLRGDGADL